MDGRAEVTFVTFSFGDRTFEHIFQEESLDALKSFVRRKLRLASDADVQLTRLVGADRKRVDLEDESDFAAFRIRARQMHTNEVEVVVPDGEHPDAPPRKRQRINAASDLVDPKPTLTLLPPAEIVLDESVTASAPKSKKRKQPAAVVLEDSSTKKRKAEKKHAEYHAEEPTHAQHDDTEAAVQGPTQSQDGQPTSVADAPSKPKGRKKKVNQADAPKIAVVAPGTSSSISVAADASTSTDKRNLAQVSDDVDAEKPLPSGVVGKAPDTKPAGRKRKAVATAPTTSEVTADPDAPTIDPRVPTSDQIAAYMHELNKTRTVQSILATMAMSAPSREKKQGPRKRRDSASTTDASATTDSEHGDDDLGGHWKGTNRLKRAPRKKVITEVKQIENAPQEDKAALSPSGVSSLDPAPNDAVDIPIDPQDVPVVRPDPEPTVIDLTESTPLQTTTAIAPAEEQVTEPVIEPAPYTLSKTPAKKVWSHVACPVCNRSPFHLRFQCPVIRAGPESVERRLAELRSIQGREATVRELEGWLEKNRGPEDVEYGPTLGATDALPVDDHVNTGDASSSDNEEASSTNEESTTTKVESAPADLAQKSASLLLDKEEDSTSSSSSSSSTPVRTTIPSLPATRDPLPLLGIDLSGIDLASQDPAALLRSSHLYIPDESVRDETSPPMELADSEAEHKHKPRRSGALAKDADSTDSSSDDEELQSPVKRPSFTEIAGGREDVSLDTRGDHAFEQALQAEARLSPSIVLRTGPDVLATQPSEAEEDAKGMVHSEPEDTLEESNTTPKAAPTLGEVPESPIETFTPSPRKPTNSPSRHMQVFVEVPVRPQTPRKPVTYSKKNRTPGREEVLADDAEDHNSQVGDKDQAEPADSASEVDASDNEEKPETPKPTVKTRGKVNAAHPPLTPKALSTSTDDAVLTAKKGKGKSVLEQGTVLDPDVPPTSVRKKPAPNASARKRAQPSLKADEPEEEEESDAERGRRRTRGASVPVSAKRGTLRKRLADASQLTAMEEQPEVQAEPAVKRRSSSTGSRPGRPRLSEDVKAQRQREKEAKVAARQAELEQKRQAKAAKDEEKHRLAQEKKEKAAAAKAAKAAKAAAKKSKDRLSPESEDDEPETLKETQTGKTAGSSQKPRMSLPGWTAVTEPTTSSPTTQHGSMVDQLESQAEDIAPTTLLPPFTQTTHTSPQMSSMDEAGEVEASLGPAADDEVTPRPGASRSSPGTRAESSSGVRPPIFASQPQRPKRKDTRGLQGLSTFTLSPHQPVKPKPKPSDAGRHTISEVDRLAALIVEEDTSDDDDDAKATPSGPHARIPLKTRRAGVGVAGLGRSRMSSPRKL